MSDKICRTCTRCKIEKDFFSYPFCKRLGRYLDICSACKYKGKQIPELEKISKFLNVNLGFTLKKAKKKKS